MRKIRLLSLTFLLAMSAAAFAQVGMSITIAPPELVAYSQPMCPQSGYLWTPGYWAYGDEGYFWVPGTWVEPPAIGLLWTPGYWGWGSNAYAWNEGYWGPTVGFYGGVNYGYGYGGYGYGGGYWRNNQFSYNTSVNNVDRNNFHNTYQKTVSNERAGSNVSYNGGRGGITSRPTAAEETAAHGHHTPATAAQTGHRQAASKNHDLLASVNHGKPPIAATSKPGEFTGKGVVAANDAAAESKATENKAAENKAAESKAAATRSNENKAAESKAAATRSNENKAAENKAAATRSNENKASEKQAAASRSNENKAAHAQPAARQQAAPRAQARTESAPRPAPAVHAQPAARQQAAPRSESAPERKAPGGKE
ncbi:MAG: YXWGXW repeat-containing protein [Terriglobales bacterium]